MRLIALSAKGIVMVLDVVRGYLAVAGGLTDISVQRARHLAETLLSHGSAAAEASSDQVAQLAEDLLRQSQTNRDLMIGLIRTEVDRTVGRMGFVREEELAAVRSHVQRLEAQLRSVRAGAGAAGTADETANRTGSSAGASPLKVATGDEAAAAGSTAGAPAGTATGRPVVRRSAVKKAAAVTKPAVKKPAVKKAPAKKAPAKKAATAHEPAVTGASTGPGTAGADRPTGEQHAAQAHGGNPDG